MAGPPSSIAPRSGRWVSSAKATVVVAVSGEPSMATAPSLANFLKSRADVVALAPSFPQYSFNWRPSTPPEALILSTAMIVPLMTATPVDPYAPVVPAIAPITIAFDDALAAGAPNGRAVAVRPATKRIPTDLVFFKVPPRRSFGRLATLQQVDVFWIKLSDNLRRPADACQGALAANLVGRDVTDCPTTCRRPSQEVGGV